MQNKISDFTSSLRGKTPMQKAPTGHFDIPGSQTQLAGIGTNNLIVGNHVVESSLFGFQ